MAITDSGQISISEIANEYGATLSNVSLTTLSTNIGLTPQHSITEFYGKSAGVTIDDLTNTITTDDGGVSLDIKPSDAVYFGNYHFISDHFRYDKSLFSDDDGITWYTDYPSLFDLKARFTVAGDYLVAVGRNNVSRYRFGSEPNSTSDTTYFTDLDLYRTRVSTTVSSERSNAVYYDGYVYYRQGSSVYKYDVSNWNGYFAGSINASATSRMPLAVGSDGRMITIGASGTQCLFIVTDNQFSNSTTIPFPSVSDYNLTSITTFAQSFILTNGSGTWVFAAPQIINGHTYYAYSTDNGDTWTAIQDHYYDEGVMNYTVGSSQASYSGDAGDITSAYFKNNKFYLGYSEELTDLTAGGLIFSSNGTTLTGLKNIGTGAAAISFNGSTMIVAGEDKILRFT